MRINRRRCHRTLFVCYLGLCSLSFLLVYHFGRQLVEEYLADREHYLKIVAANNYPMYDYVEWDTNNTRYLTIDFQGGIGNHMNQYASLLGITWEMRRQTGYNYQPVVPLYLDLIQFLHVTAEQFESSKLYWFKFGPLEKKSGMYDADIYEYLAKQKSQRLCIIGFLQSWKYFDDIKNLVRNEFVFKEKINKKAHECLRKIARNLRTDNVSFIGVHVRRGDLLLDQLGRVPADITYIHKAMSYYKLKYRKTVFVVCSDDIYWCKKNINTREFDVFFVESGKGEIRAAEEDLAVLSKCNHTVMTVGSFGWWAGWLAGGEVVYMKEFTVNGSGFANQYVAEDYFPPEWIGM